MVRQSRLLYSVDRSTMHMLAAVLFLVVCAWSPAMLMPRALANVSILYVKSTAIPTGDEDGSSWELAFPDLQQALSAASNGDQIWVAEGTYTPTDTPQNARQVSFILKNGVKLYGGFKGTEAGLDQRNADPATNQTILSGDLDGDDETGNYTNNSYHVVRCENLNSTTVLDGFTIRGGNASTDSHNRGGGMYNSQCSAILSNLIFSDNNANNEGGGIYNYASNPRLNGVSFIGNTAQYGGGMANTFDSNPESNRVTFIANTAQQYGGGISNTSSSSSEIANALFLGNQALSVGGAIFNYRNSSSRLVNVTMVANTVGVYGGGVYSDASADIDTAARTSCVIRNAILWGNTSSSTDLKEQQIAGASATIVRSIVQESAETAEPLFVRMPSPGADGLFADDPATPENERNDNDYGDLRLLPGSPAIDAGSTQGIDAEYGDRAGHTRVVNRIPDMGAYESQGFTLSGVSGSGQSAMIGSAFAEPLVVQVVSETDEPVSGGVITFAGPASGAGIVPTTIPASIDENGRASVDVVANETGGSYTVEAGGAGITPTLGFDLQNVLPVLTIEQPASTVQETAGTVSLTLSLSPAISLPVTVQYATVDISATAGLDYGAITTRTLTLETGETTATITVNIFTDNDSESSETFAVILSSPVHASLGNDRAVVTIQNVGGGDEPEPVFIYLPMVIRSS